MTTSNASSLPKIDWEAWYRYPWHRNGAGSDDKNQAGFWDEKSALFARKAHNREHRQDVEEFLNRFAWDPNERVLDIAAGPGTFAVPLAGRVAHITALDASKCMLEELNQQARRENVSNISMIEGRWLTTDIEALPPHDTVLCCNALGVISLDESGQCHMGETIERLKKTGRKRVIILIPHADLPMDKAMRNALRMTQNSERQQRIAILYHLMVKYDLLPNLLIIKRPFYWFFQDLQEGVQIIAKRLGIEDDRERLALLHSHLRERLEKDQQAYKLKYPVSQALFWWEKEA